MADSEDDFRIRLGRIGNRRGRKAIGYVKRIRNIANKVSSVRQRRASDFTGSRIGRGYAQGAVSAGRRPAGQRRVVIKARIVRIKAGDTSAIRAHLKYVQRDGVTARALPASFMMKATTAPTARRSPSAAKATATSSALSWRRRTPPNSPTSNRSCAI
jgi:hypothetical protein